MYYALVCTDGNDWEFFDIIVDNYEDIGAMAVEFASSFLDIAEDDEVIVEFDPDEPLVQVRTYDLEQVTFHIMTFRGRNEALEQDEAEDETEV